MGSDIGLLAFSLIKELRKVNLFQPHREANLYIKEVESSLQNPLRTKLLPQNRHEEGSTIMKKDRPKMAFSAMGQRLREPVITKLMSLALEDPDTLSLAAEATRE